MGGDRVVVSPDDLRRAAEILTSLGPRLESLAQLIEQASLSAPDVGNVSATAIFQHGDWACAQTRFEDLLLTKNQQHSEVSLKLKDAAGMYEGNDDDNSRSITLVPLEQLV